MNPEELSNEMAATRRAIAIYLKRLLVVEEKIDRFTREGTTLEGRASQTAGKDVAIGMSRLRTDVDIMPANELKSWIDNILSDVHIADVRTINEKPGN